MPTSDIGNITPILYAVSSLNPKTVLELGCGSGKYLALLREYLDIAQGRLTRDEWQAKIDGVEGFDKYLNGLHLSVADFLIIEDFSQRENYLKYTGYDLVLMIDSLEHIPKDGGIELLSYVIQNNRNVIVSCPFGLHYREQGAVFGNELERHRAHWTPSDFERIGGKALHRGVCAVYQFG